MPNLQPTGSDTCGEIVGTKYMTVLVLRVVLEAERRGTVGAEQL